MEIEKIYFDMDDTIADFSLGLEEICGILPVPQDKATKEQDDAMWAAIRSAGDFYYRLKPCEIGMKYFNIFRNLYGCKVEILTAIPKPNKGITTAAEDKRRWVKQHLGDDVVVNIALSASEKKTMAKGRGYILIDDLKKNIDSWNECGGTGILFKKDDAEFSDEQMKKIINLPSAI